MNKSKIEKRIICDLKNHMIKQGITYNELSERTGISISTLERYGRGEILPNIERCMDIAECLKVRIDHIWTFLKQ